MNVAVAGDSTLAHNTCMVKSVIVSGTNELGCPSELSVHWCHNSLQIH